MPTSHDHEDLADDELRGRLIERGVDRDEAAEMVHRRDEPLMAQLIAELLSGGDGA